jgi:redox-sensitive bicupin YhaK (pirin superfamily)
MIPPAYQELLDSDIPKVEKDGVNVKVIAGTSMGVNSPVRTRTPTMYLDFKIQPNKEFIQEIPDNWNAFVYTLEGSALFGNNGMKGPTHHTLLLANSKGPLKVKTNDEFVHFVLVAGEPTGEPAVQHGPIVMNTKEEIYQAIRDIQGFTNGFERAKGWQSQEVKTLKRREVH